MWTSPFGHRTVGVEDILVEHFLLEGVLACFSFVDLGAQSWFPDGQPVTLFGLQVGLNHIETPRSVRLHLDEHPIAHLGVNDEGSDVCDSHDSVHPMLS